MLGKATVDQKQLSLFGNYLSQLIDMQHPLVVLANQLGWHQIEKQFAHLYGRVGTPSHPIRKMVGLVLLQSIYKLSDEKVVAAWKENMYYQYFTGEASIQWSQPCASSDLVHFRKRIGESGLKYIFSLTVNLHRPSINQAKEVIVDTTVQEKNITFPTDAKLYKKVIERCQKEAKQLGVKLRQTYVRVVKQLMYLQRNMSIPKRAKEAKKAISKLGTIAGRQVRELGRQELKKGKEREYAGLLKTMEAIVRQEKGTKDKVYSLHEPSVSCIAKGKTGKKYEFGTKVSLASLPNSGVIVGVECYPGNPHDSSTLASTIEQVESLTGKSFERILVDKGYKGAKLLEGCQSQKVLPGKKGLQKGSYQYRQYKGCCRRRSEIEARISHLKHSHQLDRCYLKGKVGDIMNGLLAAIGYNLHLLLLQIGKGVANNQFIFFFLSLRRIYTKFYSLIGSLHTRLYLSLLTTS